MECQQSKVHVRVFSSFWEGLTYRNISIKDMHIIHLCRETGKDLLIARKRRLMMLRCRLWVLWHS